MTPVPTAALCSTLGDWCLPWALPPGPRSGPCIDPCVGLCAALCRVPVPWEPCWASFLVRDMLSTRKQGPSPAPLACNIWQLIFFCRICGCNPHFQVGIPLQPASSGPAVQTQWLIKGILFVKQSPTFPAHSLSLSLSSSLIRTGSFIAALHLFVLVLRLVVQLWTNPASSKSLLRTQCPKMAYC